MSIELKIKAKHLALEPAIIRHEEEKLIRQIKWHQKNQLDSLLLQQKLTSLVAHRRINVGNEARATNLTRIYLANRLYTETEKKRRDDRENDFQNLIIPRIVAMFKKYGPWPQRGEDEKVITQKIKEWSKL